MDPCIMERCPLSRTSPPRESLYLARWLRPALQALAVLLAALVGCYPSGHPHIAPLAPHPVPQEIVVRTTAFLFHMGARVDETWPARAEETYEALGKASSLMLEEEDVLVPMISQELGILWPREPLDFDVVLADREPTAPCEGAFASRIELSPSMREPATFLACVVERGLARLAAGSAIQQAIERVRAPMSEPARARTSDLYACVFTYAASAAMVARMPEHARVLEAPLGRACTRPELAWMQGHWLGRVRQEVTSEAFGEEAARALGTE
jgi:hypothetical protein